MQPAAWFLPSFWLTTHTHNAVWLPKSCNGCVQLLAIEKGSREHCCSWTVLHAQCTSALSSGFLISQGNAEALDRFYILSNTSSKNYRNRIMYVKIIASRRWDVFWDTVYQSGKRVLPLSVARRHKRWTNRPMLTSCWLPFPVDVSSRYSARTPPRKLAQQRVHGASGTGRTLWSWWVNHLLRRSHLRQQTRGVISKSKSKYQNLFAQKTSNTDITSSDSRNNKAQKSTYSDPKTGYTNRILTMTLQLQNI